MPSTAAARVEAPLRRQRPAARPRKRERPKHRVAGGALWIVLVAALLAGVVAMNVAVLRLNVASDKIARQRAALLAKNAELKSQLSSAAATARIQSLAHNRLGLVPADPDQTVYIRLGK